MNMYDDDDQSVPRTWVTYGINQSNALISKIEEIAAEPGIEPETAMLLKMAMEAQRTGRMPELPIAMQPMPVSLPVAMPFSGDYTERP